MPETTILANRPLSLAYLTACSASVPEAFRIAARAGYSHVGLRLIPNAAGAPYQPLVNEPKVLWDTHTAMLETGVSIFDVEIVRLGPAFDLATYQPMFEIAASLGAKAVLVAGDDHEPGRLADNFAKLCEFLAPLAMTGDLEFMPWTAVPNARTAMNVVRQAGNPRNAGILVDALHVGRSDTSLDDIRAIPRHLLHYAQICDAVAGRHFSTEEMIHTARSARLLPGEGTINLRGIFGALPPDLPISIEVVHLERMRKMSSDDWAVRCREATLPFLS